MGIPPQWGPFVTLFIFVVVYSGFRLTWDFAIEMGMTSKDSQKKLPFVQSGLGASVVDGAYTHSIPHDCVNETIGTGHKGVTLTCDMLTAAGQTTCAAATDCTWTATDTDNDYGKYGGYCSGTYGGADTYTPASGLFSAPATMTSNAYQGTLGGWTENYNEVDINDNDVFEFVTRHVATRKEYLDNEYVMAHMTNDGVAGSCVGTCSDGATTIAGGGALACVQVPGTWTFDASITDNGAACFASYGAKVLIDKVNTAIDSTMWVEDCSNLTTQADCAKRQQWNGSAMHRSCDWLSNSNVFDNRAESNSCQRVKIPSGTCAGRYAALFAGDATAIATGKAGCAAHAACKVNDDEDGCEDDGGATNLIETASFTSAQVVALRFMAVDGCLQVSAKKTMGLEAEIAVRPAQGSDGNIWVTRRGADAYYEWKDWPGKQDDKCVDMVSLVSILILVSFIGFALSFLTLTGALIGQSFCVSDNGTKCVAGGAGLGAFCLLAAGLYFYFTCAQTKVREDVKPITTVNYGPGFYWAIASAVFGLFSAWAYMDLAKGGGNRIVPV
jgi:hypothetical protein